MVATTDGDDIYGTTDSGQSWTNMGAPLNEWTSVAASADGAQFVAATGSDGIYIWKAAPAPVVGIREAGTNVVISWTVPSANFALQESSDLTAGIWRDVNVAPVLNFTNLQYQTVLGGATNREFYRLKAR